MWVAQWAVLLALLNAESVGTAQMAARGIWGSLRKWQLFFIWAAVCPAWVSPLSWLPLSLLQLNKQWLGQFLSEAQAGQRWEDVSCG